jgi:hypothetical protein
VSRGVRALQHDKMAMRPRKKRPVFGRLRWYLPVHDRCHAHVMAWSMLPWRSCSVEAHIDAEADVAAEGFEIHVSTGGTLNVAAETFTTQNVMKRLGLQRERSEIDVSPRIRSSRSLSPRRLSRAAGAAAMACPTLSFMSPVTIPPDVKTRLLPTSCSHRSQGQARAYRIAGPCQPEDAARGQFS